MQTGMTEIILENNKSERQKNYPREQKEMSKYYKKTKYTNITSLCEMHYRIRILSIKIPP